MFSLEKKISLSLKNSLEKLHLEMIIWSNFHHQEENLFKIKPLTDHFFLCLRKWLFLFCRVYLPYFLLFGGKPFTGTNVNQILCNHWWSTWELWINRELTFFWTRYSQTHILVKGSICSWIYFYLSYSIHITWNIN